MTFTRLWLRNLWFHRRAHLAVLLGVALGTAVLTGSLLLGDSLRGSLRDLALRRLGHIDGALAGDRFFPADLAERTKDASQGAIADAAPALLLRGTALVRMPDGKLKSRAGQVQVIGVDERFWPLLGQEPTDLGSEVLVNQPLADELGIAAGDRLELRFDRPQNVPSESVIGQRNQPEGLLLEESRVRSVLPLDGPGPFSPGRFTLAVQQSEPRLVFVQLRRLQNRLARDGDQKPNSANTLLVRMNQPVLRPDGLAPAKAALRQTATLEDQGLELRQDATGKRYLSLESRRMLLEPELVTHLGRATHEFRWPNAPTLTYLANLITREPQFPAGIAGAVAAFGGQPTPAGPLLLSKAATAYTPYCAVTGLDPASPPPFGPLLLADGQPAPALKDDEILLSDFVANDLWPLGGWRADVGKPVVRLSYFLESEGHELKEAATTLKLAGVVPVAGNAADRSLTPEFPGLRGARIADWKPPFPKRQWHPELIRETDEAFYRKHRVTPKAYVSPTLARKLWASRWGDATSLRIAPGARTLADFEKEVRRTVKILRPPESAGLVFQPVKLQGLAAAQSGTALMFGWLFVGFSFFLIIAAALLVGLLFRLGVEQRGREWGLFFALGWPLRLVRKLALREGLIVAAVGALLGLGLAIGYAKLLIAFLRVGWKGALESSFLELHLLARDPAFGALPYPSLSIGFLVSVFIAAVTLWWALRGFAALAPASLLGGQAGLESSTARPRRWPTWLAVLALFGAVALAVGSFSVPPHVGPGLFFGSGFLMLVAGLGFVRLWLRRRPATLQGSGPAGLLRLGFSYAGRNVGRSMLTVGLLACGVFLVVAVQAFRPSADGGDEKASGTGGFRFVGQSDVPLPEAPNTQVSWRRLAEAALGPDGAVPAFPANLKLYGLRLKGGDDASCLNLYEPRRPRVLGAPPAFIARGGFRFILPADATDAERANPWLLLDRKLGFTIPLLADDHAAQWVLQKQIGDEWTIDDEQGRAMKVRLVGMLSGSLLQSELIVNEGHFRTLYPSSAGYRFFLADVPAAEAAAAKAACDQAFGEGFGLTLEPASRRLAAFQAVEATYLSTFQALGGLGLLLGAAGLGVVLLRNLNERRGEWALCRAVGFSERDLTLVALAETLLLVGLGLAVGLAAALVAIAPTLSQRPGTIPWLPLAGLVALIPVIGLASGAIALRQALRAPLLPSLQRE